MEGPLHIPGYTAERRLGSMSSSMWLGFDDATGQPVTLRLVQGDLATVRAGLSTAILVMRALQHPHVIPFLDMVDTQAGAVLVLGPAEGGSLAEILVTRRTLPPGEMVTACAPVAEALADIHQHGIVHGAITPDEIVFARDGRPMLAGVGLATIGAQLNLQSPTIAPEVLSGGTFTPAADVYSVAAMGVVALTGPVSADRLFAASAEQLLATGVAPAAQAVVTRAIGRNPGRRPDAETLVNALYAIADPEPVELILPEEAPASVPMPPAGQPLLTDPFADQTSPFDAGPRAEEHDEVTAYMRQTSAPRRARHASGGSAADTGSFGAAATGSWAADLDPDPAAAQTGGGGRRSRRAATADQPRVTEARGPADRVQRDRPHQAQPPKKRRSDAKPAVDAPSDTKRRTAAKGGAALPPRSRTKTGGRRPSRGDLTKLASVLVVLLLVAGAVVIGMQIFGGEDDLPGAGLGEPGAVEETQVDLCGGPRPAPEEEPPEVSDWTQEVQRLYGLRAQAFEELDAELLCQVYAPTSKGLIRDVELMQEYAERNVRPQNLSFEVIDAELVERNGGSVVLKISDRLPVYQLVDTDGEVVDQKPGMENETWNAELVPIADLGTATPTWRFG